MWPDRVVMVPPAFDEHLPRSDCIRGELRAIIGSDVIRGFPLDEQFGKQVEHVVGAKTTGDRDRQAFPRVLVNDGEHAERLAVVRPRLDEVIGPDVIRPVGRAIAESCVRRWKEGGVSW